MYTNIYHLASERIQDIRGIERKCSVVTSNFSRVKVGIYDSV